MNLRTLARGAILLIALTTMITAADKAFVVKYVSTEHVYLNAGSADGLAIGHRLLLKNRDGCPVELEIIYVAEHSASCVVSTDSCAIAVGDRVTPLTPLLIDSAQTTTDTTGRIRVEDTAQVAPAPPKSYARQDLANLSGSVGLLLYSWNDKNQADLDFFQTTARLNLKARHLFGSGFTFNLRTRGRLDKRQRAYNSRVGRSDWENRIWEMSISYDDPRARVNLYVGRVLPKRIPSAGYLDGAVVETKITQRFSIGLLTGMHPEWAYDSDALSLQRAGGYVTYSAGEVGQKQFEQTIAGIGEYHAANVSRELLLVNGRCNAANIWGFYHSLDIDINRSWRKDKTGSSFALSSAQLGVWYRFLSRARLSLNFDNHTNYWTYESRSTVDSLFDDHLRSGIRLMVDATLPAKSQVTASFGSRNREGDPAPTYSYSFSASKSSLWRNTARGMFQYSGFDGHHEHGHNYSVRLTDNLSHTVRSAIAYGKYSYHADDYLIARTSSWWELSIDADLGRRTYGGLSCQFNSGDDIEGFRLQSEIGWRF